MSLIKHILLALVGIFLVSSVAATDVVYQRFKAGNDIIFVCPRRSNSTHQFGCSSRHETGRLYLFDPEFIKNSFEALEKEDSAARFLVIINAFDFDNIRKLREAKEETLGLITGVVIFKNDEDSKKLKTSRSFSHEISCPNTYFSQAKYNSESCRLVEQNLHENPYAGFAYNDWPFPVVYIRNDTSAQFVKKVKLCLERNLATGRECHGKIYVETPAAINSRRCYLRNNYAEVFNMDEVMVDPFCNPVMARNYFAPLVPIESDQQFKDRSVTIVAARIDSFSYFNIAPGESSVYSGLILLYSVAEQLRLNADKLKDSNANILFALFDGESFGFVGSSSFIYYNDIEPSLQYAYLDKIKLANVKQIIEFNNLALAEEDFDLTLYSSNVESNLFKKFAHEIKPLRSENINKMLPSSAELYTRFNKSIDAFLFTGVNDQGLYSNPLYHSMFSQDDIDKPLDIDKILPRFEYLSERISRILLEDVIGREDSGANFIKDSQLLRHLTECILFSKEGRCNFTYNGFQIDSMFDPLSTTTETLEMRGGMNFRMQMLSDLLFLVTSRKVTCGESKFPDYPNLSFYIDGVKAVRITNMEQYNEVCETIKDTNHTLFASQTMRMWATSPYFDNLHNETWMKMYGHLPVSTVAIGSATTSAWDQTLISIFMVPSKFYEYFMLTLGLLITIGSFTVVSIVNNNAEVLFDNTQLRYSARDLIVSNEDQNGAEEEEEEGNEGGQA